MVGQFTTERQQAGHTGRVSNVFPAHGQSLGITTTSDWDLDTDHLTLHEFHSIPDASSSGAVESHRGLQLPLGQQGSFHQ